MSPDHAPLLLRSLLGVSLGLVTIFVAEDVVSAEMQISTNCENRFGTPLYCCLEQAKELEIEFEIAKYNWGNVFLYDTSFISCSIQLGKLLL